MREACVVSIESCGLMLSEKLVRRFIWRFAKQSTISLQMSDSITHESNL